MGCSWIFATFLLMLAVCRPFSHRNLFVPRVGAYHAGARALNAARQAESKAQEILVCSERSPLVEVFLKLRPSTIAVTVQGEPEARWHLLRGGMQIDSTSLEAHYEGKHRLSDAQIASKWDKAITQRIAGQGPAYISGPLAEELQAAVQIVQRASYVSRAFQRTLTAAGQSLKTDASPVTVADYAVQALVLDELHRRFPTDLFVAEEDSVGLRTPSPLTEEVLRLIEVACGQRWSLDQLQQTVDLGQHSLSSAAAAPPRRCWVLDPVDGTKGFIRAQHYCVALGLLVEGVPVLSVLGCPNLCLRAALGHRAGVPVPVTGLLPDLRTSSEVGELTLPAAEAGAVCFAVSGHGAFARSMDHPLGSAVEVSVSTSSAVPAERICESYEASASSKALTRSIAPEAAVLLVDGMVKQALLGMGAAEATVRLPPCGYREKVWDHAPGAHFVIEAGGVVTDTDGHPLDMKGVQGGARELGEEVRGVVAANCPAVHRALLTAIRGLS